MRYKFCCWIYVAISVIFFTQAPVLAADGVVSRGSLDVMVEPILNGL